MDGCCRDSFLISQLGGGAIHNNGGVYCAVRLSDRQHFLSHALPLAYASSSASGGETAQLQATYLESNELWYHGYLSCAPDPRTNASAAAVREGEDEKGRAVKGSGRTPAT